ncbi:MAG: phage scaffolding protein [Acutalibacteraceae bacterium]|nr:phage scaffolding protein [Acutalibacteraceae bacterium]
MENEPTKTDTQQEPINQSEPDQNSQTEPIGTEVNAELEALKTTNTTYEKTLKSIFGVADDEELGDIAQRVEAYNNSIQAKITAVNDKIISAELRALQGYDTKLLAKVIDRSGITVADDGTVTGLQEAVETAVKEYPAVVAKKDSKPYAPYNPAGAGDNGGANKTMNDIIRRKRSY